MNRHEDSVPVPAGFVRDFQFFSLTSYAKRAIISFAVKKAATYAGVMELADVVDSKSTGSDTVPVRVRPPAPSKASFVYKAKEVFYFVYAEREYSLYS